MVYDFWYVIPHSMNREYVINNMKWYTHLDGANPAFIRSLKLNIGERADYDKVIEQARRFVFVVLNDNFFDFGVL